jgi:site-specific recombinase XerD
LPGYNKGKSPANAGRQYPGQVFEPREVLRLLNAMPQERATQVRDRAMFAFMWRTGVRLLELPEIRELDLDQARGIVRIRRRPNRRERDVFVFGSRESSDWGWQQLQPWLELRSELGVVRSAPLFCVASRPNIGGTLHPAGIRDSLGRARRSAGLHGRVHPQGFRNTLAAELYAGGLSIARIHKQLGHDSLAATHEMLERLGAVHAVDDLHAYRPPWRSDDF